MTAKKKVVSVTRKASVEDKLDSLRWTEFVRTCGLPFEELSTEWLDFYDACGDYCTDPSKLEKLIDTAIQSDVEKGVVQEGLK